MENKTEVQLKAKATNWLITILIGVVSWFGRQQYEALNRVADQMEKVSATVQVQEAEITNLKKSTSDLFSMMYEKTFAKHEEIFELKKPK